MYLDESPLNRNDGGKKTILQHECAATKDNKNILRQNKLLEALSKYV